MKHAYAYTMLWMHRMNPMLIHVVYGTYIVGDSRFILPSCDMLRPAGPPRDPALLARTSRLHRMAVALLYRDRAVAHTDVVARHEAHGGAESGDAAVFDRPAAEAKKLGTVGAKDL